MDRGRDAKGGGEARKEAGGGVMTREELLRVEKDACLLCLALATALCARLGSASVTPSTRGPRGRAASLVDSLLLTTPFPAASLAGYSAAAAA
jgi:hypothetical protein